MQVCVLSKNFGNISSWASWLSSSGPEISMAINKSENVGSLYNIITCRKDIFNVFSKYEHYFYYGTQLLRMSIWAFLGTQQLWTYFFYIYFFKLWASLISNVIWIWTFTYIYSILVLESFLEAHLNSRPYATALLI